jgi:hypothetical protein
MIGTALIISLFYLYLQNMNCSYYSQLACYRPLSLSIYCLLFKCCRKKIKNLQIHPFFSHSNLNHLSILCQPTLLINLFSNLIKERILQTPKNIFGKTPKNNRNISDNTVNSIQFLSIVESCLYI